MSLEEMVRDTGSTASVVARKRDKTVAITRLCWTAATRSATQLATECVRLKKWVESRVERGSDFSVASNCELISGKRWFVVAFSGRTSPLFHFYSLRREMGRPEILVRRSVLLVLSYFSKASEPTTVTFAMRVRPVAASDDTQASSSASSPAEESSDARKHPPLVIVHGLMGCGIADKDGVTSFVSIKAALKLRWRSLAQHNIEWSRGANGRWVQGTDGSTCHAAPIRNVKLCGLCSVQNYLGEMDEYFTNVARRRFSYFTFDWRRDCFEIMSKLEAHLQAIREKEGEPAQVVAHSLGCNFVLGVLHSRPELFHSVIFAGGIFGGCIGFYHLLQRGMAVGFNSKMINPKTVATWASVYQVASPPEDPLMEGGEDGRRHLQLVDEKALRERGEIKTIDVDWYDISEWERLRLGPWQGGGEVSKEMRAHVTAALENGRAFQKMLRDGTQAGRDYPPVAVLLGDGHTRRDHFLWDASAGALFVPGAEKISKAQRAELARTHARGKLIQTDGTVPTFSTTPHNVPHVAYHYARGNGVSVDGKHVNLLDETEQIDEILVDLEARASGAANGNAAAEEEFAEGKGPAAGTATRNFRPQRRTRRRWLASFQLVRMALALGAAYGDH